MAEREYAVTPVSPQTQNSWFRIAIIILLLFYWVFARSMERIDLTTAAWVQANFATLPGAVVFVMELFHWRVLRHFVPLLVGWWLARNTAVSLVQALYSLPHADAAKSFLKQLRSSGRISAAYTEVIQAQTLANQRSQSIPLPIGMPGRVVVKVGEAAVTERNGRVYRTLGPGSYQLGQFEYVKAILDLRQQQRLIENIPLVTKDGIDLTADVHITYRLSTGGEPATRAKPYPYDDAALRVAAYDETILASGHISNWETVPQNVTKSQLTDIIAKYRLDEILQPEGTAAEPHLVIRNELERRVRSSLIDRGIELMNLHVGHMNFPERVTEQYIKYWQAHWEIQASISQADGEAQVLEEMEIARAEAEMTMIQAILEGVRRAQAEGRTSTMREVVALRLIEALEKVARQSQVLHPLPMELLPGLADLRHQLQAQNEPQATDEVVE